MPAKQELFLPSVKEALAASEVVKTATATSAFSKSASIVRDEEASSIKYIISPDETLVEPNAIVRYLGSVANAHLDSELIAFDEAYIYPVLIGKESNLSVLEKISVPKKVDNTVGQIVLFGGIHGLVYKLGSKAKVFGANPGLEMWYNAFSKTAAASEAIKTLSTLISKAPKAAPAASALPVLEYTGQVNVNEKAVYKKTEGKIRPKAGERNVLITSALPYVNNVPHLGNIIGSVLSADVYARYAKQRGYNALFICGTDEYGTATETKALEEKVTPYELCTKYHYIHKETYDWFQVGFDYFGRTTTEKQTEIAQDIFLKLNKNGYLTEESMEQLYCPEHNGYLADRFVEGTCPKCGYEDARGDQCDSCGNLLNPFELIKPRCKIDNASPISKHTNHIFLLLDKLQDEIAEWSKNSSTKGNWSSNSINITQSWIKEGLHSRCITRDLKWGTPVPLEAYKEKVLYVWFDACIGYVSITANYTDDWEEWWKKPDNVELYQFMGKDNVPFHTVVFPGSQIGTREEWTMLHHLSTTEYLQYEGGKFSKSRNVGVFGNQAKETGISPSVWRFYLLSARPESQDSQFSWDEFVAANNNELLPKLGNFVNRLVKFVAAKQNSVIPKYDASFVEYDALKKDIDALLKSYNDALENTKLRRGLEIAMEFAARGNKFLQDNLLNNALLANSPEKAAAVIGVGINIIYIISAVIAPYMPETADSILKQLNAPAIRIPDEFSLNILGGHNIGKPDYLFTKIEADKVEEWRSKFGGKK